MGTPYLGEIKICSFGFAPSGYAMCNGQTLMINQNQALFSLLGTTYGGNGQTTFALPDLRGCTPTSFDSQMILGQRGGIEGVTLLTSQIPQHSHGLNGTSTVGNRRPANNNTLAADSFDGVQFYAPPTNLIPLAPASISNAGGSQSHPNMQPFLVLNFVIALQGAFPSRN